MSSIELEISEMSQSARVEAREELRDPRLQFEALPVAPPAAPPAAALPPPPAVLVPLNQDPDLLNKLFQRFTATNAAALADRPLFGVRTLTFTVSGAECAPGVFVDNDGLPFDFSLTLKAMSSEEEIKALTDAPPGHAATMHLTKRMLYKVNGSRFPETQRDFLWEALGMRVRALCFQAYLQLSGPSSAAVGKFQESSSIGTA